MNPASIASARFKRLVLALTLLAAPSAFAQNIAWGGNATVNWTGNSTTNWLTSFNWAPAAPGSNTSVVIDTNSGNQPSLASSGAMVANVTVGADSSSGASTILTLQSASSLASLNGNIGGLV